MQIREYKNLYGLIGYPLSHSFSKRYFYEKFAKAGIKDSYYELFPIEQIEDLPQLIKEYPNLRGLNITIPYKEVVFPYLDAVDDGAKAVGALNTIKIQNGSLVGFNTDVYGFEVSLLKMLSREKGGELGNVEPQNVKPENVEPTLYPPPSTLYPPPSSLNALILGTGGAAKAVVYVLEKLGIPYLKVSRGAGKGDITYDQIDEKLLSEYRLIINTTPLGMSPKIDTFPMIPYAAIGKDHFLYDLVYNPAMTSFLEKGQKRGAAIQNGLEMLYLQAEKAWDIWNNPIT